MSDTHIQSLHPKLVTPLSSIDDFFITHFLTMLQIVLYFHVYLYALALCFTVCLSLSLSLSLSVFKPCPSVSLQHITICNQFNQFIYYHLSICPLVQWISNRMFRTTTCCPNTHFIPHNVTPPKCFLWCKDFIVNKKIISLRWRQWYWLWHRLSLMELSLLVLVSFGNQLSTQGKCAPVTTTKLKYWNVRFKWQSCISVHAL